MQIQEVILPAYGRITVRAIGGRPEMLIGQNLILCEAKELSFFERGVSFVYKFV